MDSGASDTVFMSRDAFMDYKLVTPWKNNSAKAENGNFEIISEGNVIQCYHVDGREREIAYTCALYTLTLNANLVSVSALDKAGLTTMFGNGKGVTCKSDGTIVLTGKNVNGMYLLKTVNNLLNTTYAMTSLSKPTSLEQWHQRLAHCSPLTMRTLHSPTYSTQTPHRMTRNFFGRIPSQIFDPSPSSVQAESSDLDFPS